MSADAPAAGRRRVDPGSIVTVGLTARVLDRAKDVRLIAIVPPGWSPVGTGGGTVDPDNGTITWMEGILAAGDRVTETVRLRAPARSPENRPAFDAILEARLEHAGGLLDAASLGLRVAPDIIVEHVTLARIGGVSHQVDYLAADEPLLGVDRYDTFRIGFQLRNADTVPVEVTPRLQFRLGGEPAYADVPLGRREIEVPFYVGVEWRPMAGGRGTLPGPLSEEIPTSAIRVHDRDFDTQEPAAGARFMGSTRVPGLVLAGDSFTEVEFTVRVTRALPLGQAFDFRLVDGARPIHGAALGQVWSASRTAFAASPGQRDGIPVGPPVDARPSAVSGVDFPLVTPALMATTWLASGTPTYRLAVATQTAPATRYQLAAPFTSLHVPDMTLVSDTCAVCHRSHVAENTGLVARPAPLANMCFTCHDGTGSNLVTTAQYTDPAVPDNSAGTPGTVPSAYYRHDALSTSAPIAHTLAKDNEFGGALNRHAECADCHNTHNATATPPTQFTDGWSVSGRQVAISGVSVANGLPGEPPTYTFLSGAAGSQPDREYEVCLKCHSGFTTLPAPDLTFPSTWALDKAIELNPANASYHPVEARGTNDSDQMTWSLNNSSPYKQWNFTTASTVRCVNCHGDPRKYNATLPTAGTSPTAAGDDLAPHTSQYRGLLIQNYRDRVLKSWDEAYDGADFALCYVCHAEAPFRSGTAIMTVFDDHDLHVSTIAGDGPRGTSIDSPGEGGGNAICAECHFRTHSTAQAFNAGDRANTGLVNFAPNVEPYPDANGVIKFTKTATGGSCTLICHGWPHDGETY